MDSDTGGILLKAVSSGRPRQVRLLLESGIYVDATDDCGQTALIRAIFLDNAKYREKMVRILLRYGATVSKTDVVGRNALSWATLYGRSEVVALLLENGDTELDINSGDMNGATPLFHAVSSGSAATVKLLVQALVKYGLSSDVPTLSGVTPLMHAMMLGHDVCASILKNQGMATVGLTTYDSQKESDVAKRWAKKTLQKNQSYSNSKFPPILSQTIAQKIKYRENRAEQLRVNTPVGSDEESSYGSEVSYYTEESFDQINLESPREGWEIGSEHAVSLTSSTEVNGRSSSEEADFFSTPFTEKPKKSYFHPSRDLHQIYKIQEEEISSSYRKPVTHIEPHTPSPAPSVETVVVGYESPRKGRGDS